MIRFTVSGDNEHEITSKARRIAAGYFKVLPRDVVLEIDATAVQTIDEQVVTWIADVEARRR